MSKIRCIRVIWNTERTGLDTPESFMSPPALLSRRKQESSATRPALSRKVRGLMLSSILRFASSTGVISRLKSSALLASRCSTRGVTTATSPRFSSVSSILRVSFPHFHQADAVRSLRVARVVHRIHCRSDNMDSESAFLGPVECGRRHSRRIESFSAMIEPDDDPVEEGLYFERDLAIRAARVGVSNHVAGRFIDG